jgi:hypothetical protein
LERYLAPHDQAFITIPVSAVYPEQFDWSFPVPETGRSGIFFADLNEDCPAQDRDRELNLVWLEPPNDCEWKGNAKRPHRFL